MAIPERNEKITVRQLQALLILDILGAGVIVLPRRAAQWAGQDGWAVILVAALAALACTWVIMTVGRMFPGQLFTAYCAKILSRPAALVITLGLVFKIIVSLAMETRFFYEILQQTMLRKTPFAAVFAGLSAVSAYAAAKGYETRARVAEVLLPLVFVPLIVVFTLAALNVDFTNLLPVLRSSPGRLAAGSFYNLASFGGLELCLLVHPYLSRPKEARGGALKAVALIGVVMLAVTAVTIAKFGPVGTARQMWPVIEMMDAVDFPGAFIERQDALVISFWIVSVFSFVNAGLFFAAVLLKSVFKKGSRLLYILLCLPVIYALALTPPNIEAVYAAMRGIFLTFGVAYMLVIPLLLLIVAKLRGLGEKYD